MRKTEQQQFNDETTEISEEVETEELFELLEYYANQHREAREAKDPGTQRTDTYMDDVMKSSLEMIRDIEDELFKRDAIEL